MFSGELDRVRHPLISRTRGILLGSILLVAVTAALVSAKTLPFMFSVTLAAFLVAAVVRTENPTGKPQLPGAPTIYLLVFLLYALLSAIWAISPDIAVAKTLVAMAMTVGTATIVALIRREARPNLLHLGEGVCIGLLIGLVYLLVELLSDQSIKLAIYRAVGVRPDDVTAALFTWSDGKLVKISIDDLSRNMSSAALLIWPALMMIVAMWRKPQSTIYCLVLAVLTWLVVWLSRHESSKLALVVGLAAFALAHLSLLWTRRLAIFVWFAACLAVLPAVLLAHRMDLHQASWLQQTARHRLVIWNFTAERLLESPLVGIGASSTYVLGPKLESANPPPADVELPETLSTHSHNIYLQTWLELGLIGAVLLTLFGLSLLRGISLLGPVLQPYAYATFASAVAMGSSSYGIWQVWYMALFAFSAVTFSIGAQLMAGTSDASAPRQ
jgi:O-antigen ligase